MKKSSILDMALKWRDIVADMVIAKCMWNMWWVSIIFTWLRPSCT